MSISKVFYTLIDDKSAIFQKVDFQSDHIIFRARLRKDIKRCPCCRSSEVRITSEWPISEKKNAVKDRCLQDLVSKMRQENLD